MADARENAVASAYFVGEEKMKCLHRPGGKILAYEVENAHTFWARLWGLMLRPSLEKGKGMLLSPCPQIHTCFMRFPIDAVFCDKMGKVLYVRENMQPWRWGRYVRGSRYTLELPGGSLAGRVQIGDELVFEENLTK